MDLENQRTGSVAELAVAAKLVSLGYSVSIPFNCTPYDLIADKGGKLSKVQVKTATLSKYGSYRCSLTHGYSRKKKYLQGDCDVIVLFAPYSNDFDDIYYDGFYVIPIKTIIEINAFHAVLFPSGRGRGNHKSSKWEEFRNGWKNI
tara:strand:- start:3249 stop:3686 length:438 start_codon:yes stop_codon:yes gene_type:complete